MKVKVVQWFLKKAKLAYSDIFCICGKQCNIMQTFQWIGWNNQLSQTVQICSMTYCQPLPNAIWFLYEVFWTPVFGNISNAPTNEDPWKVFSEHWSVIHRVLILTVCQTLQISKGLVKTLIRSVCLSVCVKAQKAGADSFWAFLQTLPTLFGPNVH